MIFTPQRRGRPKDNRPIIDHGTPELRKKYQMGLTKEALDLCIDYRWITPEQHWAGNHLRYLYTKRYGVPQPKTMEYELQSNHAISSDQPLLQTDNETNYKQAIEWLEGIGARTIVVDICVYMKRPRFLQLSMKNKHTHHKTRQVDVLLSLGHNSVDHQELEKFQEGLSLLAEKWSRENCKTPCL